MSKFMIGSLIAAVTVTALPAIPAAAQNPRQAEREYRKDVREANRDYRRDLRKADSRRDVREARKDIAAMSATPARIAARHGATGTATTITGPIRATAIVTMPIATIATAATISRAG